MGTGADQNQLRSFLKIAFPDENFLVKCKERKQRIRGPFYGVKRTGENGAA